jgi:phosphatidate phosphatase PAH1
MYSALSWAASVLGSPDVVGRSGAIDVVAVRRERQRETGSGGSQLVCSPWHVRIASTAVGHRHAEVSVLVNGRDSGLRMKLGDAGEAFFVERIVNTVNNKNIGSKSSNREGEVVVSSPMNNLQSIITQQRCASLNI